MKLSARQELQTAGIGSLTETVEETGRYDYYVSVTHNDGAVLAAGPYATHEEAESHVRAVSDLVHRFDRMAVWYGYGVSRKPARDHRDCGPQTIFETDEVLSGRILHKRGHGKHFLANVAPELDSTVPLRNYAFPE